MVENREEERDDIVGKKRDNDDVLESDPNYKKAKELYAKIKELNMEIRVIDEALCEMQLDRARAEAERNIKTTPFWHKWFEITKSQKSNSYFCEPSSYQRANSISLCEAEFVFLRGFKSSRIQELEKEVAELSAKISED